MAKTPSVSVRDFLASPSIETMPKEALITMLEKALELGRQPYDANNGWPANVHKLALSVAGHIQIVAKALDENDAMTAMIHGYKLGECRQKIITLMAAKDSLSHQEKALAPRVTGGKETGQRQKEAAEETTKEIINHWNRLKSMPEHNRAAIIAEKMELSPATVRRHIKQAGLKKTNTS